MFDIIPRYSNSNQAKRNSVDFCCVEQMKEKSLSCCVV